MIVHLSVRVLFLLLCKHSEGNLLDYVTIIIIFLGTVVLMSWLHHVIRFTILHGSFNYPHFCQHLFSVFFPYYCVWYSILLKWYLTMILICIFLILMILNMFSSAYWTFICMFWRNVLSLLPIFKLGSLLLVSCGSSL